MNNIKFRYKLAGTYYTPQYQDKNGEWIDFKVKTLTPVLKGIAYMLGIIGKWEHTWHYTPKKGENVEDMSLIFPFEVNVMAFLGAAKCIFDKEPIEFNL